MMGRRHFTSSIAGAAFAAGANDRVNVAVIGLRGRGRNHIHAYSRIPGVNVAAVCDVDERVFGPAVAAVEQASGRRPKTGTDIRRVLGMKDIDAISVATPNHWHALAGVWACQAGKDAYIEKPVSHNIAEGRRLVQAARKHGRIVQAGTQGRSVPAIREAMEFLHSGKLGKPYMARAVCFVARESIGTGPDSAAPAGVDYDLWTGPAELLPFNETRFHYNWHWFWNTGNGETGNNGPHLTDLARWALGKKEHPVRIQSMGGRDVFRSMQETPNTQTSLLEYADGSRVELAVRGLYTNAEEGMTKGVLIYCSEGWMRISFGNRSEWATFFGRKNEPGPRNTSVSEEPLSADRTHFANFVDCVRSRRADVLAADAEEGHFSTAMCHLANIAWRVGRQVEFDGGTETFPRDEAAQALVNRNYRAPFIIPERL